MMRHRCIILDIVVVVVVVMCIIMCDCQVVGIENFVQQVGLDQAQSLLSKAGVVETLPSKPL